MFRHVFIIPVKEGITEELLQAKMQEMRDMKLTTPEIEDIHVGKTLGWIGNAESVIMTIDVKDKEAFDRLVSSDAHQNVAGKAEEAFVPAGAIVAQIEL